MESSAFFVLFRKKKCAVIFWLDVSRNFVHLG